MRSSLTVAWIVLSLCGCRTDNALQPQQPIIAASDGVAGIVAHTESAQRHVTSAIPHADSTGRIHLRSASDEHREVLNQIQEVRSALAMTQHQIAVLSGSLKQSEANLQRLDGRWYVTWGRWIERALWIIGIGWLVLGVMSVLLGLGNPVSWSVSLGKEIVRLVPAMNLFAWLRDWLVKRRTVTVAKLAGKGR